MYYGAAIAAAVAAAAAAATVYFLDPRSGRRRRALVRDQMTRIAHDGRDFIARAGRDARHRARGLFEKSAARFRFRPEPDDDSVLIERIRSTLGRLSRRARSIETAVTNGIVRLRGDILEEELASVLAGVESVRGVQQVVNELRVHNDAGSLPRLQGGRRESSRARPELR